MNSSNTGCGFGIGSVIAAVLSWSVNHSIAWCIIHTLLGWIYVIYHLFKYNI